MADATESIRAFIAMPLPGHVRRMLGNVQSEIRKTGMKASWPDPDSFHLTLRFLGAIHRDIRVRVQAVMEKFSGTCPDLTLSTGGLGIFPGIRNARVVWADINGQTLRLSRLYKDLDKELYAIGFSSQTKRFSPHITLARLRAPVPSKTLIHAITQLTAAKLAKPEKFHAGHMALYKSRLTPKGAVHTCLFQVKLG
jgi:RNA 2',3'-cyclic 3'-phosphodiesterase